MLIKLFNDRITLGRAAAEQAATAIRRAISERGAARIIAATAASQLEFLDALTKAPGIDWTKVEAFHLDEYIGLPVTHPGSFRKMLMEQLVSKTGIRRYHLLAGDAADPAAVAHEVSKQISSVSGRTGILRLTIPRQISTSKNLTLSSISTRRAAGSRSAKHGSPIFPKFRSRLFRCRRNRYSRRKKFSPWFQASVRLRP